MRRKQNGLMARALRAATLVLLLVIVASGIYVYWSWTRPLTPGGDSYLIQQGASLRSIARQLRARGTILETYSFVLLGYVTNRTHNLKTGEYRFRSGITANELLDQIVAGRVIEYPVTLLEGWTFPQVLQTLAQTPKLHQTLVGLPPTEIMARLGQPGVHPEGRFYPDTYYFPGGHTDLMVLQRAFEKMRLRLEEEWADRSADVPLKTTDEALALASIIEKETGRADEREEIAGVFANRLRKGMRLQSDPTVIYGLGRAFNGNIRLADLRRDTPYNTYTRRGLPPTPIAMPSGASLAAALNPANTGSLYFVANGDGGHVFSRTLTEHNAAVTKYVLKGKQRTAPVHSTVTPPRVISPQKAPSTRKK